MLVIADFGVMSPSRSMVIHPDRIHTPKLLLRRQSFSFFLDYREPMLQAIPRSKGNLNWVWFRQEFPGRLRENERTWDT
jgi:hypothetical protein